MATYVTGRMVQDETIDTRDLQQGVAIPPGAVMSFAMSAAPVGWLPCDGAAISRTTYASLFAAVRTIHGAGDGSNTFNVPDLRGEFIRGWDNGRAIDSGRVFGQAQAQDWKTWTWLSQYSQPGYVHDPVTIPKDGSYSLPPLFGGKWEQPGNGLRASWDTTSEIRPRNIALLYCIKF